MTNEQQIAKLKQLGFNQLEAEVYVFLLTNPATTAYKVGKSLNKPTANVYKSIDSLAAKGAVLIENNKSKICKAVRPGEFLNHYRNSFLTKTDELAYLLHDLKEDPYDENTYTIKSVPLIIERFNQMMQRAKVIAVIDAFPDVLELVVPAILEAINRKIEVYIQIYKPIDIPGADLAMAKIASKSLSHWDSQQLNLIIDGEEYLVALMDSSIKKVLQATWSNNYYMACILHAGRMHEQTIIKLNAIKNKDNYEEEVKRILQRQIYFYNSNIPGFDKLLNRQ
jgi:sugar-specific transcriptional regulator TrmB